MTWPVQILATAVADHLQRGADRLQCGCRSSPTRRRSSLTWLQIISNLVADHLHRAADLLQRGTDLLHRVADDRHRAADRLPTPGRQVGLEVSGGQLASDERPDLAGTVDQGF